MKTEMLQAGKLSSRLSSVNRMYSQNQFIEKCNGFTLIELVVVMTLAAIMLFVAIPRFQETVTNDLRLASQWIIIKIPQLKAQAATEKVRFGLHFEFDDNRMWVSHAKMTEDSLLAAQKQGRQLSASLSIRDVEFPQKGKISSDRATIYFYEGGYSDKAIIHLEDDDGNTHSFLVEPFLNRVQIVEGYVEFES
jgi:prepilin-type N-terminal cleavage/methylation domain-containing protein